MVLRTRMAICVALGLSALVGCGSAKVEAVAAAPKPPADADGDGIPDDGTDRCLDEKEDGLPPKPADGCKSSDADGDGVPDDGTDHCLTEKEDGKPPDPKDGCPTTDPDGDGISSAADKCPNEPETKNGFEDDDGCPDKAPRVRVTKNEVKIDEKILFAFGKATIEKQSDSLLNEIAQVVDDNPQIEFLEVAGHADKVGTDPINVQLTKQRAQAVLDALVKRGIERRRLRAQGYGRYCPLDPGDSDEAREKNRRVEFKIMRIDGVETGVALGCEEAQKHGVKPGGVPKTAPTKADDEKWKEKRGPLALVAVEPTPGGKPVDTRDPAAKPPAKAPPPKTPPAKTPGPAKPPAKAPPAKAPPPKTPPPPPKPTGALAPMTAPTAKSPPKK